MVIIPRWLIARGDTFPRWFKVLPSGLLGAGGSRFVWMGISWVWHWAALELIVWVVLACLTLNYLWDKISNTQRYFDLR